MSTQHCLTYALLGRLVEMWRANSAPLMSILWRIVRITQEGWVYSGRTNGNREEVKVTGGKRSVLPIIGQRVVHLTRASLPIFAWDAKGVTQSSSASIMIGVVQDLRSMEPGNVIVQSERCG